MAFCRIQSTAWAIFSLGVAAFVTEHSPSAQTALAITDSERTGLEVSRDSLWHRTLHFTLPLSGDSLTAASDLRQAFEQQFPVPSEVAVWVYRDSSSRPLIVILTRIRHRDGAGFRDYVHGLRSGMTRSRLVAESLAATERVSQYQLIMQLVSGPYFVVRCLSPIQQPVRPVICIEAVGPNRDLLEGRLDRLHWEGTQK
jgi:hypothetical protein